MSMSSVSSGGEGGRAGVVSGEGRMMSLSGGRGKRQNKRPPHSSDPNGKNPNDQAPMTKGKASGPTYRWAVVLAVPLVAAWAVLSEEWPLNLL